MSGYIGIGPEDGEAVPEKEAYSYALNRCLNGGREEQEEFREMLVEWYFSSGSWLYYGPDSEHGGPGLKGHLGGR